MVVVDGSGVVVVAVGRCMVWWWWKRKIFEVCVCACVCVHNYISKLNYQYFLIVFTMSLHASPTATITSVVDATTISGDNNDLTTDNC